MQKIILIAFVGISSVLFRTGQTRDDILFSESFDNANLESRGWYDGTGSQDRRSCERGQRLY